MRQSTTTFAALIVASLAGALAPGLAAAAAPTKIAKGPYLQSLGPTSVEIRAELDVAGPVTVTLTPSGDAGAPRTVRDDASVAMHVVQLDGLAPGTHYVYVLTAGALSAKGEFVSAPAPTSTAPFSFLVYGDNRTDSAVHAAIVRAMTQTPSDFLVNTGDLVQDGASSENWQTFFDIEGPLLRDRNVFACVGNHEITDGAGTSYLRYFGPTTDARGAGGPPKLYGSFRWGNARFFLIDAMERFDDGPERSWLDDELSRADGEAGLAWRVVVMHHAPWSAGPHGGNSRAVRAGIPALLAAHHVDLVLAGHDHIYERGLDAASGLRYVISGGGGAPLYEIEHPLPSTRKAESVHHTIVVSVTPDTMKLVATRDDGSVLDRCGLARGRAGWDCDPPPAPTSAKADVPKDPPPAPQPSRWGCTSTPASNSRGAPAVLALLLACVALARSRYRG
jgi:3',5'-cyclic AMP phosphodiesterase CpdA